MEAPTRSFYVAASGTIIPPESTPKLPTKTTMMAMYLYSTRISEQTLDYFPDPQNTSRNGGKGGQVRAQTHPAVIAMMSCFFARVKATRPTTKVSVKAAMVPSRSLWLCMWYSTTIGVRNRTAAHPTATMARLTRRTRGAEASRRSGSLVLRFSSCRREMS